MISSIFAGILSFHNTITRYLFAMGRDGLLWRPLANTHPRYQSPYIAGMVQTAIALVVVLAFAVTKQDPYRVLFSWTSAIPTLGILLNQIRSLRFPAVSETARKCRDSPPFLGFTTTYTNREDRQGSLKDA
jgi:amino acid transporter